MLLLLLLLLLKKVEGHSSGVQLCLLLVDCCLLHVAFHISSILVRMSELPTNLLQFLLELEARQCAVSEAPHNSLVPPPTSLVPSTIPTLPTPPPQKRCGTSGCKRKLLLTDASCRCGIRHCGTHRLPEEHACPFDFKGAERKMLETQVVACVADKMGDRI
jgi:hypothetical protein